MFVKKVKCLLDKSGYVGAVFLDLKKAFDTVDHQVLLSKLTNVNFTGVCTDVNVHIYADDVVIFTFVNNWEEVSITLATAMENVQDWLTKLGLILKITRKIYH